MSSPADRIWQDCRALRIRVPLRRARNVLSSGNADQLEGLRRREFSKDNIKNLKEAYRILYRSNLRAAEAVVRLAELGQEQPELGILVEFLEHSERGVIR